MKNEIVETVLEILGRTFHVKCTQSEVPELKQSAKYLEEKISATRAGNHTLSFERVAIIAALNITHELLFSEQRTHQLSQLVSQKERELMNKIDEALVRYKQMELEPADEV